MCITTKYISNNIANITKDIRSNYTYVEDPPWRNKSNRLKKIDKYNSKYFDLTGDYSYDPDGNFTSLTRSYNSDNFSYGYYSGTNRLKKVTGSTDQYTYDYNGNQTNDYLAENTGISYDHRNLITEITRGDNTTDPPATIKIRYKFDESGNRIRKTIYRSTESNPPPLPEETEDLPTGWSIILDDYYLREVSGKEIAIYSSYTLQYWNVWSGSEIVGRINNSENVDRNYYLKDHLGSIRVVLDNSKTIVSANDYDMWGYYLQNRTYSATNTKNKFTGKERDNESSYDYFGARYYDARVGRWGGVEPLLEKYLSFSPYQYGLLNPMNLVDLDGRIIVPDEVKQNYPKLAKYISNKFEKVVMNNQSIVDAYSELTGLTEDELREFVKDKSGPLLEITDLGYDKNKNKVDAHWLSVEDQQEKHINDGFEGPYIAKLQLDKEYARIIEEKLANGDKSEVINVKRLLKHTLTHEIAHGAFDKTKIWKGKGGEKGWLFEMKAYKYIYQYLKGDYQKLIYNGY